MTRVIRLSLTLAAVALASACASPEVVDVNQIDDANLTCAQIKTEIAEADRFEREARDERGVTGKNVAAGLLFWPALLVTYSNTDEAIDAARARKDKMTRLFEDKNCN